MNAILRQQGEHYPFLKENKEKDKENLNLPYSLLRWSIGSWQSLILLLLEILTKQSDRGILKRWLIKQALRKTSSIR